MSTGTVKWFDASEGYGVVCGVSNGKELFVHHERLADGLGSLRAGQRVAFEEANTKKNVRIAINVRTVE